MVKKIKLIAKGAVKKTGVFMKKAGKKANKEGGKMVKALKKEWKKEEPQREAYKKEIKKVANKAGKKGLKLFNAGVKNGVKISGDVVNVIKKDINEIREQN